MLVVHRDRNDTGWVITLGLSNGFQTRHPHVHKKLIDALMAAYEESLGEHPVFLDEREHTKLVNGMVFFQKDRTLRTVVYEGGELK